MSLYEVLKASKAQRFPEYWTLLWGRKLSDKLVKTLTGTLPLTFTAKAGNAVDWVIEGNDDVGKNLMPVTLKGRVLNGLTITVNNGEITINGTATAVTNLSIDGYTMIGVDATTQYIFSGIDSGSNASYYMVITLRRKSDNTFVTQKVITNQPVTLDSEGSEFSWKWARITVENGAVCDNVKFKPMLRLAETSADFEPYQIGIGQPTENGYIVPLSVNGNTVNIPIGNTPLTEGKTVSKTSTGVDVELFNGDNTVSTTLYNKPTMEIKYK